MSDLEKDETEQKAAREALGESACLGSFRERLDWGWLCARVRGAGVPESDVDDVAQGVVIAMSRAENKLAIRPEPTESDARRAALRVVLRDHLADYWRDRARSRHMKRWLAWSAGTADTTAPSPEELSWGKERRTRLHAALEAMRPMADVYQVALLNGLHERPMREVVAILGISEGTGFSRLLRAKRILRDLLGGRSGKARAAA